ncbi:MAG: hypothetical protein GKS06_20530 [Acidobacteria bacterium]|nr:hypothetical protein [Acidobacteriota bacterium]
MPSPHEPNVADMFDRHRRRIMLAMLLVGLMSAGRAFRYVVAEETEIYLQAMIIGCALGVAAIIATVAYWKIFKLPADQRQQYFSYDGFVTDAIDRAKNISFVVTFVVVSVFAGLDEMLSRPPFVDVPTVFYFNVIAALMLITLGSVFFFLDRDGGEPEPEWDAGA